MKIDTVKRKQMLEERTQQMVTLEEFNKKTEEYLKFLFKIYQQLDDTIELKELGFDAFAEAIEDELGFDELREYLEEEL